MFTIWFSFEKRIIVKKKGRLPEVDDTNCGKRVKKSVFDSFNSLLCKTNIPMNILFEEKGLFLTKGESDDQEKRILVYFMVD